MADQDVGLAPFEQDTAQQDGLRHAEIAFQSAVAFEDSGRVLAEEPPAAGQGDAAAAALEELAAGELLQLGDMLADGRLRDAERLGGGGETAQFGNAQEYAQTEVFKHKKSYLLDKGSIFFCSGARYLYIKRLMLPFGVLAKGADWSS